VLAQFPRLEAEVSSADARRAILVRGLAVHDALRAAADAGPFRRQILLVSLQSVPPRLLQGATPYFWSHLRSAYAALASQSTYDLGPRLDRAAVAALDSFAALPVFRWEGELAAPGLSRFHATRLGLWVDGPDALRALRWSEASLHFVFAEGHEAVRSVVADDAAVDEARPVCAALHPAELDVGDNAAKLSSTAEDRAAFASQLDDAWALLCEASPDAAAIVRNEVQQVIPLRLAERHLSYSLSNFPGAIFVGAARSLWPVAEALVHEAAHVRLNHAAEASPLTLGGRDTVCYSPWRDDPRPVEGVVHGVYAFSLVLGFWLESLESGAERLDDSGRAYAAARCAALDVQLEDALSVLRRCRLAPLAERVVGRLASLVQDWPRSVLAADEYERARCDSHAHRQRMLTTFPELIGPDGGQ
jgi:HEXXH motif-containing protein